MTTINVDLIDGPRDGDTVAVALPWPRAQIPVDDGSGDVAYYVVTDENPGSAEATWRDASPTAVETGEDPLGYLIGPPGDQGPPGPAGDEGPEGEAGPAIIWSGEWDDEGVYGEFSGVSYEGSSYFVKTGWSAPAGAVPGVHGAWQLMAAKGDEGPTGATGDEGPPGEPGEEGPPGASGNAPRDDTVITTASLAANASEAGTVALGLSFRLIRVVTNRPARVRLYASPAQQSADAARAIGTDPVGNHGLIAELVTTSTVLDLTMSPQALGSSLEATPDPDIAYHVTNLDATTGVVTATLTTQTLE